MSVPLRTTPNREPAPPRPSRVPAPLPFVVVTYCGACDGDSRWDYAIDDPVRGPGQTGHAVCRQCGGFDGKLTLYVGTHDGHLVGYIEDLNLIVTFDSEADARAGKWSSARPADRLTWRDDAVLAACGVKA